MTTREDLLTYGYRMLGSVSAAQELVRTSYEHNPGADRGTLFRTATAACLTGLARRPLPTDLGGPSDDPVGTLVELPEVIWLEPCPDALLSEPAASIDLDQVGALQHLPPRQRAALVLRDVSGWPLAEVADVLGASSGAVDATVRRARSKLATVRAAWPSGEALPEAAQQDLLARYRTAFNDYDVPTIVSLMADDAVWEMPPFASWFRGARNIGLLISSHCPAEAPGDQVLVPTKANGRPAFAVYMRDPAKGVHRAFQIQVLTLAVTGVVHAIAFFDLSLFEAFDLPMVLTELPDIMSNVQDPGSPRQGRPEVARRKR